jgi:hypothetical protein
MATKKQFVVQELEVFGEGEDVMGEWETIKQFRTFGAALFYVHKRNVEYFKNESNAKFIPLLIGERYVTPKGKKRVKFLLENDVRVQLNLTRPGEMK